MQSCAVALGKYNIRANAVLPGTIATDINKEDLSDDAKREGMIKRTCLGRLGRKSTVGSSCCVGTHLTFIYRTGRYRRPCRFPGERPC